MKTTTHWLAAIALASVLGTGAAAQNDDVGIGKTDNGGSTPAGTEDATAQTAVLSLSGSVAEEAMIGDVATVVVAPVPGALMDVEFVDAGDGASVVTPVGGVPTMVEITPHDGTSVQGHGHWNIPDGLQVTMHAADETAARTVVLLAQFAPDGQVPPLESVLATGQGIEIAYVLGDLATVDVAKFQRLAEKHDAAMPGLVLTWAFASLDESGDLHVSAVRASSDGTLLEVLTQ